MIQVPFDFNPIRTERATGVTAINAGEYALVKPISLITDLLFGANIIIEKLVHTGSNAGMAVGHVYTNSTDKILMGTVYQAGDGNHRFEVVGAAGVLARHLYTGAEMNNLVNDSISVVLFPGDAIRASVANGSLGTISWQLSQMNPQIPTYGVWAKSATVITGTSYSLEIFKNKT